jgi:hypothetical protein
MSIAVWNAAVTVSDWGVKRLPGLWKAYPGAAVFVIRGTFFFDFNKLFPFTFADAGK